MGIVLVRHWVGIHRRYVMNHIRQAPASELVDSVQVIIVLAAFIVAALCVAAAGTIILP